MVYAKKSLGQNFLKSKAVLADIIKAAQIQAGERVLEIGPGRGVLTGALLASGAIVTAVEKDDALFELLREKFATEIASKKLDLVHGDILEITLPTLRVGKYKVVANIPYYITGMIFRKFLEEAKNQPSLMVVLVQKEVAERIIGCDGLKRSRVGQGKESILSISVKAFGTPRLVKKVPASAFSPQPKVDSAILAIENISKENFKKIDEKIFFELVKKGFSQKRKVIRNNLKDHLDLLARCKISEEARAEDLRIEDWFCLARNLTAR